MKYILITFVLLIAALPSCSLRREKKKQSVHKKRRIAQQEAYAANPGIGCITPY